MTSTREQVMNPITPEQLLDNANHQNTILKGINQIYEAAFRCATTEELGRVCVNMVKCLTGSKFGFISTIGPNGFVHDIVIHQNPEVEFRMKGLQEHVLSNGRTCLANQPDEYPACIGIPEGYSALTSFLIAPFLEKGRVVGMIGVTDRDGGYRTEEQEMLEAFAATLCQVLQGKQSQEEALKKSREDYQSIIQYAPAAIYEIDFGAVRLRSVNDVMCSYSGYSEAELLAMNPFDVLDEKSKLKFQSRLARIHAGEEVEDSVEYKVIAKDGREIWVVFNMKVMFHDGETIRALVVGYDITERKRRETNLAFLSEIADQINSLSATAEIIGNIGAKLGNYLSLTACHFLAIDEAADVADILESWQSIDMPMAGPFRIARYFTPEARADFRAGKTIAVRDTQGDSRIVPESFAGTGDAALVATPFHLFGEWRYLLLMTATAGRDWRNDQVELIREVANRLFIRIERIRTETVLRESEERFRLATETAHIYSWELDIGSGMFKWSQNARNVVGFPLPTTLGEFFTTLHPEDYAAMKRILAQAIEERGEFAAEFRLTNPVRGGEMWVFGAGIVIAGINHRPLRIVGIWQDITKRKLAEEETLASERELLQVTLNSLGEGVVAFDQETRIILINETAANLVGRSQAKAIGQLFGEVFFVYCDSISEPIDIRTPQQNEIHLMMLAGDRREVPIAMRCAPIKARDGQVIGTVAVFQDISERLKTQQELFKADKLESLGILAGGIAHDFNNILGAVLSNVQLAIMKFERNQDIRKYLVSTVETIHNASELTKQLLTFSKGGAPVRKDASLIDLIRDTAEFTLRGANVKVEFAIPDNLWPARIDKSQISQVISNLVINAKQAMPNGGVILISAANLGLEAESRYKPGKYVKVTVKDQGIGIPRQYLGKIFDPFFTTKKEGNGLGLSTSYSIITQHEGYIEVESAEGVGTTFHLYLPASSIMRGTVDTPMQVAASGTGFKILLMDDEKSILDAVGEMLSHYGYQVVLARDGDAAIAAYQAAIYAGERFDVVIADLTVPGSKGGQEVVAALRSFDPQIKAIISSGYADDPIIADYERFGFQGVASKPYKIDELHQVLQRVLNPEQLVLELRF